MGDAPAAVRPGRLLGDDFRQLGHLGRARIAANLSYLALVWATVVAALGVFWARPGVLTFVLAFVLVSSRHQALLNIEHECIHGMFVRGRTANNRVAVLLCASPAGSPYWASRARHLAHHKALATAEDPDAELHAGSDKLTRRGLIGYFGTGLLGGYAARVVFSSSKASEMAVAPGQRRRDLLDVAAAQAVLLALFSVTIGWWGYLVLWALPAATLTVFLHLVRSFGEHAITAEEQAAHGDRLITTVSNPIERFLVAPFFMNFHAEHHLFPWVLAANLPEVKRRLDAHPQAPPRLVRVSYTAAIARYVRALL